jgi:tetratricopeptide (TPR) repeat protein
MTLASFEKGIDAGKLDETQGRLLEFAIAHPRDVRAVGLLGRLRLKQSRTDEALSLFRRALTLDPEFTEAKIDYAQALLLTGQDELAGQVLSGVDPSKIKDPILLLGYAQALMLSRNCADALKVADGLPAAVKNGDALPIRASCDLQMDRADDLNNLIPFAKKAVLTKPDAVLKFADILIAAGQAKAAAEILTLAVRSSPKSSKALMLLGKAEILEKAYPVAGQHLAKAAQLQPDSAEILFLQARLEVEQGNALAALPLLTKASLIAPRSKEILSALALTAIKASRAREAVAAAEKLLVLAPDDPDALYLLGAASLQGGNLDKAQTSLEQFTQMRPKDSRGCLALGLTLAAKPDKIEAARTQLRHCLEFDPSNVEAKYQLGLSYKAQGDTVQAIQLLEEVVTSAPRYSLALRDLGAVYLQAGDDQKARTVLERAVAIDPSDADTHFQLSRLYNLIGEPDLAKKHLELFQKLKVGGGRTM